MLNGNREQTTQVLLAAAIKHSHLLGGGVIDIALREQWRLYAKQLEPPVWRDYLDACRGRDPDMSDWSDSTRVRLRSTVYSVLVDSGYLDNARSLALRRVYLDPLVVRRLAESGEKYALWCMDVTE